MWLNHKLKALIADRRGVAAMEAGILGSFLLLLLLPISDAASQALTMMRVKQTMRNIGSFVQYNPPPDITNPASTTAVWRPTSGLTLTGYTVRPVSPACMPGCLPAASPPANVTIWITVMCGDPPGAACTAAAQSNPAIEKWYYMSANVALTPMFLAGMTGGPVNYSERYQ